MLCNMLETHFVAAVLSKMDSVKQMWTDGGPWGGDSNLELIHVRRNLKKNTLVAILTEK